MGTSADGGSVATALFGSVRTRVLGVLFGQPQRACHLREITRAVGAGHGAVQRELRRLVACGLVTRARRGNQVIYQANENAPVFRELHGLITKTVGLANMLRGALATLADRIEVAFVFGSAAEGTLQPASDIDLMVIGRAGLRDLASVLPDAQEQLGREINPVTISPAELRERLSAGDAFIKGVLEGPKILIIGGEDNLSGADTL